MMTDTLGLETVNEAQYSRFVNSQGPQPLKTYVQTDFETTHSKSRQAVSKATKEH